MPFLPVTVPPAIVIADNRDYVTPGRRPDPYPGITKYTRIEQQRTQQRMLELAPKAATDPEAARQYQQLQDLNARQLQILNDPNP